MSDAEDDADLLVAYWESDIDGVLSDVDSIPDSAGTVLGYGYLTEGEHAIELHVEDTTGKPDTNLFSLQWVRQFRAVVRFPVPKMEQRVQRGTGNLEEPYRMWMSLRHIYR